jgi:hypothetical protein
MATSAYCAGELPATKKCTRERIRRIHGTAGCSNSLVVTAPGYTCVVWISGKPYIEFLSGRE